MALKFRVTLPLIFLLITSGVFGKDWNVIYETKSICALKGSSVNMSCTYIFPQEHKLINTFWINLDVDKEKSLKEYKDRVEYIEDRQNKTAVLRLNNVTENDEIVYRFRFITDKDKWTGEPGIQLHVSALQVQAPQLVLEKETFNLTCRSTCDLTDRFIWYKDGQALNFTGDILQFQSFRSDSGRYSCAVRGHEYLPSPAVNISVEYPPQNTSVSVSGSGVIVEGDSVTLNCISDSNPPAEINWFKGGTIVGSGDSYSITDIKSEASGDYYCSARNKHGSQTSAAVNVNVMYRPRNVSVLINGSGVIVEGDSVTLNCISDSNPPAEINWIKGGTIVGSGRIYNISNISSDHSGEYKCRSRNKHGEKDSDTVMLDVMYPPSVSVWVSGSGVIVEGDSVTLNCISDSNPPALNFSWFKENETSAVGSGQSFSISSFSSSFSGRFYCEAQNKHGSRRSASVSLTVKDGWRIGFIVLCVSTATVALFGFFLLLIIIIIIVCRRKKMRKKDHQDSDNHLNDAQDIEQKKTSAGKASESGGEDTVLYASVKHHRNKDTKKPEEDEIQYASITVHRAAAEAKSTADQEQDLSVIYSSIKII